MGLRKRQYADGLKAEKKTEYFAKLRNVPSSPRKMRLVVDMIRGQEVFKALGILKFSNKEASNKVDKLLRSAIANYEQKTGRKAEANELYVKTVFVDCAPMLKRLRPAPQGRGYRILLNVTGSLDRMDVAFDLSTEDDVTVANELQSMSPDQRANQAMNMLLYGIYTGPGTKGDASITGNALYSFLESQLNSWMANNVKGVDISFGINQYDRTIDGSSSQTTSYSYQVSKSLFNDRFKIVIGGNYSTDADADENFSQNLINDISFDYYLNKGHTMYVRIFRHTGYESILEGEITQTGVGFVYRKKLNHLVDMFKFLRPRRSKKK